MMLIARAMAAVAQPLVANGKGHGGCSVPLLAMLVLGGCAGTGHQAPSEAEGSACAMPLACTQFMSQAEALTSTASFRCDILQPPRSWEACSWALKPLWFPQ